MMTELQKELRRNQAEYYQRIKEQYLKNKVSQYELKSETRGNQTDKRQKKDNEASSPNTKKKEKIREEKLLKRNYSHNIIEKSFTWIERKIEFYRGELNLMNEDIFATRSEIKSAEAKDIKIPYKLPVFMKKIFLWLLLFLELDIIYLSDDNRNTDTNIEQEEKSDIKNAINKIINKVVKLNFQLYNYLKNMLIQLFSLFSGYGLVNYYHLE